MMPGVSVAALRTRLTPAAPVPSTDSVDTATSPPRPWKLLVLVCLAIAALTLLRPVEPDLRPVGVDHLGPRDRPLRPHDHERPVVEAAARVLHDGVRARGRRRRAQPVAGDRARRRLPRHRDGVPARLAARRPLGGCDRRGLAVPRRRLHPHVLARQLRGHPRRALPVGGRAPPRRAPRRRVPARPRRRAAAAGGVAVLRPLRAVARVGRAAPAAARARRLRRQRLPVVRARVLGLGRLAARRQPRAPAQPRLAGVRRAPVPRGVRPLVLDPLGAGPARLGHRARPAGARAALGRPALAVRRRRVPDDRGGADDGGRLRRQPPLRRAAGRAAVRARGRRLGRGGARRGRALRARARGGAGRRARGRRGAVRALRPRRAEARTRTARAWRPRSTTRCR